MDFVRIYLFYYNNNHKKKDQINMQSAIGEFFINRDIEVSYSDVEKCQVVGLYFTAAWCPPCVTFNPVLVEFYNDVNYPDKRLEIIQISSDQDEASFTEYFTPMP